MYHALNSPPWRGGKRSLPGWYSRRVGRAGWYSSLEGGFVGANCVRPPKLRPLRANTVRPYIKSTLVARSLYTDCIFLGREKGD